MDAPCSGTGTIRRNYKMLAMYGAGLVSKMARSQLALLESGWMALKPGGTLVYSTCTLEPEEDEALVSRFLPTHPDASLQPIELTITRSAAITEWEGVKLHPDVRHCLRICPQDNDTEGFFVAKLQKAD